MPLDLAQPLTWTNLPPPQATALKNLQGNILKGHGREHTINVFLRFTAEIAPEVGKFLSAIPVTTAFQQLLDADAVRAARRADKPLPKTTAFVALFLAATAYRKLGIPASSIPPDAKFIDGLKARQPTLQDPPIARWDAGFRDDVDVMLLVGDTSAGAAVKAMRAILANKPAALVEIAREIGVAYRNANGDGLEHFGYVDGRSQPLMIEEDVARERDLSTGTDAWDPRFPLSAALVQEPGGDADAFGSYFVFRKLEQNVRAFRQQERDLAKALALPPGAGDLAGAMAIGRFRDGTPVAMQHAPGMHNPVPNNFGFDEDPAGRKCPLHAHIRKTNPRGDSVRLGSTVSAERTHLMPRRGITYGARRLAHGGGFADGDRPARGVGLLFMAYNSDVGRQFEFAQAAWANNPDFVDPATGLDPAIGQATGSVAAQSWPTGWAGAGRKKFPFDGFARMLGGEYFFAPSLSFIRALPTPAAARRASRTNYPGAHVMRVQARPGSEAERLYYQRSALAGGGLALPKAIASGISPSVMDDLLYHGGKLVPQMEYQNIFLGAAEHWFANDILLIDESIKRAMRDRHLENVMRQYFPGTTLSCDPRRSFIAGGAKPTMLDERDVQETVVAMFDAGRIARTDLGTTLFNLVLPSGTELRLDSSSSTAGLGGFHGSVHIRRAGKPITLYYSANVFSERRAGGRQNGIVAFDRPWKNVVGTLYHEINEFRTDPDVGDAIAQQTNDLLGWTSRRGHEVGDQPISAAGSLGLIFKEVAVAGAARRIPIQFMYSNVVHGAEGPIDAPHGG